MKCSTYPCKEKATTWVEWRTLRGGTKGAPVCPIHLTERNKPDNFGVMPMIRPLSK